MVEKIAKLVMVTPENSNKYYNMTLSGGTIQVEFGRVGANPQRKSYPESRWNSLYRSKIRKGYVDHTELRTVKKTANFRDIYSSAIAQIVSRLRDFSNDTVSSTYLVSAEEVTQAQIDEAQRILNALTQLRQTTGSVPPIDIVNTHLLDLYRVIPRKMKNTRNHLMTGGTSDVLDYIIDTEQSKLDSMASQVVTLSAQADEFAEDLTVLEAMGLELEEATEEDVREIKRLLSSESEQRFVRAWRVTNKKTQEKFDIHLKGVPQGRQQRKLFWHGSRNENWWGIMGSGLVLRPTSAIRTGSMFGNGLYFADRARKSFGYTSLRGSYWTRGNASVGFMGVFDVHLGKMKVVDRHSYDCYSFNSRNIGDHDSVFARAGVSLRNNEYIVYTEKQTTIKYLVEVR